MKTKLLLSFFLLNAVAFAQTPIASYYSSETPVYGVVPSTGSPYVQTAGGANMAWTYDFSVSGSSVSESMGTPTTTDISTYPGTTNKLTVSGVINGSASLGYMLFKESGGSTYVTGGSNDGLEINYITDNLLVGAFPLNYGYNNTDAIAGTYNNGSYSGTFTGTITFSVDAYGTIGGTAFTSTQVTRLKSIQTLNINHPVLGAVGTMVVTTYSYYGTEAYPVLRVATTVTNVPILQLNETKTRLEILLAVLLNTPETPPQSNEISIAPNPVGDLLSVQLNSTTSLESVTIYDLSGRLVKKTGPMVHSVDVSQLQAGTYLASFTTDKGTATKKFIKK